MSENIDDGFSGFMPMIDQVHLSNYMTMINTDGDLVSAYAISIKARDGSEHVFSIEKYDLMRLSFLITKVINSET